MRHCERDQMQ